MILKYILLIISTLSYLQAFDQELYDKGKLIYEQRCTYCHKKDGSGTNSFSANLQERISFESTMKVIKYGSNNFKKKYPLGMPPLVSDAKDTYILSAYISLGMPPSHPGKQLYKKYKCAMCHGEDGSGIEDVAPNISFFNKETLKTILTNGKKGAIGTMPDFSFLGDDGIEAVSEYIIYFEDEE